MITSSRFSGLTVRRFLSGAILAALLCSPAAGEVLVFSVKGTITEKRTGGEGVSVFAGDIGDEFHGIFAYDTDAVDELPSTDAGSYPLVEFTIDGTPLNVSADGYPALIGVVNSVQDRLLIRGFHTPAIATVEEDGFNDNGSTSIELRDFTHSVFTDDNLPEAIDVGDFDDAFAVGPYFGSAPTRPTKDRGVVTEITLLSMEEALLGFLIADVEELVDSNISRGLTAKLETALARLADANPRNDVAACNSLEAFNHLVAAQAGKKIDDDTADYLIYQAMEILFRLDCP